MFGARYVSIAMALSSQINWSCNVIIGLIFPYLVKWLGPYSFVPFAVVLALTFIFALIWLPETYGTTPEELQAALVKKNTDTVYHNMDIDQSYGNPIDVEWKEAMDKMQQEDNEAMNNGTYDYGFEPIVSDAVTKTE